MGRGRAKRMGKQINQPGYVYLIQDQTFILPTYKIGYTATPRRRLTMIAAAFKTRLESVAIYNAGVTAHELEMVWLSFFNRKRIAGTGRYSREWFYLTERDVRLFKHVSYRITKRLQEADGREWWISNSAAYFSGLRRRFWDDAVKFPRF